MCSFVIIKHKKNHKAKKKNCMKFEDIDVVPVVYMSTIGSSKHMYFGLINSVNYDDWS